MHSGISLFASANTRLSWVPLLFLLVGFGTPADAQGQKATPEKAVVVVRVEATSLDPKQIGVPVATAATGWFADNEGRIVTSHHIIDKLGIHDEKSRNFEILMTPGDTHPQRAEIIAADPSHDLLLLKIGATPEGRTWLRFRGPATSIKKDAVLCYRGFPGGRTVDQSRCGLLVTLSGLAAPRDFLWETTLDSAEGLSGSPVYLEDCPSMAIGVLKGRDAGFAINGLVVPSKYLRLFADLAPDDGPCDGSSTAPVAPPSAAPFLSYPYDNMLFSNYPRLVTLRWRSVPAATHYLVRVQYQLPTNGQWFDLPGYPVAVETEEFPLSFVGGQPGRWQVQASNSGGTGPASSWWYFRFDK